MKKKLEFILWKKPTTRLGLWSAGLSIGYLAMSFINNTVLMHLTKNTAWQRTTLIFYGFFMLLCGLAAGVLGLIAVIKKKERSWMTWAAVIIGTSIILFVAGEFLFPH